MNKIKVSDLKEGYTFTSNVYIDEKLQSMLVPANLNLKSKEIERIKNWGIEEVYTEGEIVDPDKAEKSKAGDVDDAADSKFFSSYAAMIEVFSGIVSGLKKGKKPEVDTINKLANQIIDIVSGAEDIKDIHELIGYISKSDKLGEKYAVSGINCAFLSILVGMELGLTAIRLQHLAVASLLHDIGMLKIPERITDKNGQLTPDELNIVRMHSAVSYQVVIKNFGFPETIARIVLQHHERWDGKGYPNGLAGDQINLLSRIIAVTDSFEAMNRAKSYRSSMIGYAAMKQILNENSKKYDASIVKLFIKVLGIYPPGSFVILNDTSIGKVVKVKKIAPLRPVIKLLIDSSGNKCEDSNIEIDLVTNTRLFIVKVIDLSELEGKLEG
ncbi:MAG: HD-GYP domain-containing protein [Spirochaetales bacterium]|nr:HD-GYP domain-containing protein [Spirochaetales bacterium]